MSVVHYRFKNAKEFSKVAFNGPYISLEALTTEIGECTTAATNLASLLSFIEAEKKEEEETEEVKSCYLYFYLSIYNLTTDFSSFHHHQHLQRGRVESSPSHDSLIYTSNI